MGRVTTGHRGTRACMGLPAFKQKLGAAECACHLISGEAHTGGALGAGQSV